VSAAWQAITSCAAGEEPRPPIVRPLDTTDGRYDWPDDEVHHGIAGIRIDLHGDDPDGALVKVHGRTREAVEACIQRVADHVRSGATAALFGDGAQ
jgi:hypothetical protein